MDQRSLWTKNCPVGVEVKCNCNIETPDTCANCASLKSVERSHVYLPVSSLAPFLVLTWL